MIDVVASISSIVLSLWAATCITQSGWGAKILALTFFVVVVYMASRLSFIGWGQMSP